MYFEFESTNNNEEKLTGDKQSDGKSSNSTTSQATAVYSTPSPSPRRRFFGSSQSLSSVSPPSSLKSAFLSPILSSSPLTPPRHRRYSMHSDQSLCTLDSLPDDSSATFCDLALITKKKLLQLNNNNSFKTFAEIAVDPDLKLNQPFAKHSNSDLRRGVLLSSVQRSLSVSSDDLLSLSKSTLADSKREENGNSIDDMSMDCNIGTKLLTPSPSLDTSLNQAMLIDNQARIPRSLKDAKRFNLGSYTPSETQINGMSSLTFTSTTSMAGSKNSNHPGQNCRNYIKKLNADLLGANSSSANGNNFYYSNFNQSSKLTLTMSYSKLKRLHSSSPSKYSSPYHTISNSVCKDFNLIFANSANQLPATEWDLSSKRLKVMHPDGSSEFATTEPNLQASDYSQIKADQQMHLQPEASELNQLAQDFHRLKTPFT